MEPDDEFFFFDVAAGLRVGSRLGVAVGDATGEGDGSGVGLIVGLATAAASGTAGPDRTAVSMSAKARTTAMAAPINTAFLVEFLANDTDIRVKEGLMGAATAGVAA